VKGFFHITSHERLKILPLTLLTQSHQLFVAELLMINHELDLPGKSATCYTLLDAKESQRLTVPVLITGMS
jgi:hypothetical protein